MNSENKFEAGNKVKVLDGYDFAEERLEGKIGEVRSAMTTGCIVEFHEGVTRYISNEFLKLSNPKEYALIELDGYGYVVGVTIRVAESEHEAGLGFETKHRLEILEAQRG